MRLTALICFFFLFAAATNSQPKQPKYLGEASWRSVAHQQPPQPLAITVNRFPAYSATYRDSIKTISRVSVNPGTVTIHQGKTMPVTGRIKFIGIKLPPPQRIRAERLLRRDNAMFNISYSDKQHGYAARYALDFAEDKNHNIWIASEKGLMRYDGYYYYLYARQQNFREMADLSLAYDSEQRLWCASENGVYFIRNDSLFSMQSTLADLSAIACKQVYTDRFQRVWIATKNHGAICISGNDISIFDKRCGLLANYIETVFVTGDGNILLSCRESGMVMIEPDRMRMFFSRQANSQHHIITSFCENEEGIWAGSFMSGLFCMGPKDTACYSFDGKFQESIYDIRQAPKGIWVSCYGNYIAYLSGNKMLTIDAQSGLLNRAVYRLFTDSYQNLWIGNPESGFSRINENSFYLQAPSNRGLGNISKIIPGSKEDNWIISNGNGLIYRKNGLVIGYYSRKPSGEILFNYPQDAVLNNDGTLWLGSYGEGIAKFTGKDFLNYRYSNFTDYGIIRSIKEDAKKDIWFCPAKFGLIVYDKNSFHHYTTASGLLSTDVFNLFSDADKNIYWTFSDGFQRAGNSGIETLYIGNAPFKGQVKSILSLDRSTLLLATVNKGLLLMRDNKVYRFGSNQGLMADNVNTIICDKTKTIWISTEKSIESFRLNGTVVTSHRVFTESNGDYIPDAATALLDSAGTPYWMVGDKMLVYDPAFIADQKSSPTYFTQVIADRYAIPPGEEISILPSQKLTINYQIIYWGRENNLKMKYLLFSSRNDSTEYPIQDNGTIIISDVTPGNYRIILKAIDNNDSYYSTPVEFTVRNFWYNTWVFRISISALVIAAIVFYFRQKARRQLVINEILKRKVREQTETIQKEKDALLVSYQTIDLQNKEKDVLIEEINHRVKNNLQFISAILEMQLEDQVSKKTIQALLGTSIRIKAMSLVHELLYTRPEQTGLPIRTYIRELVNSLSEMAIDDSKRVNIQMDIEDEIMDSKTTLSLGMIISELVSNSLKHAFENIAEPKVTIQLKKDHELGFFYLIISDNGNGYQQDITRHNGVGSKLVDIYSRQLDGTYIIQSSSGFRYELTFKPGEI